MSEQSKNLISASTYFERSEDYVPDIDYNRDDEYDHDDEIWNNVCQGKTDGRWGNW